MASLLLRSAGRVLRRSLPQGRPFWRQPTVVNPRLFSSHGVNMHSCALQRIENCLDSIEADLATCSRTQRATGEKLEAILQKKIENELADKKRERVVLGVFAVLGITVYLVESKKEKGKLNL